MHTCTYVWAYHTLVYTVNGTLHSCNGDSSAYYVGDNTWNTTYISNDGDELEIDVFYATYQSQLWVRHLQVCLVPTEESANAPASLAIALHV